MQIVVVYMVVYLLLLSLELLGKSLQHRLLTLLLVFALVVGLGFVPVYLDSLLDLLDLQSQCSQGCWDLSH
jgi:Tfp pilus assembly protein PilO